MYTLYQWILLFYIYCFAGWVWESAYVSIKLHKWINRGFLKGPFLPIYGSGAIVVLISTVLIKKYTILVFIIGMISATILEYITGAIMEKLFHVRYWDCSEKKFNINGYICLVSSLAWGFFSLALVYLVNPLIEPFIISISDKIIEVIVYVITIFVTIDAVQAFNNAMDLKNVLVKITERNERIYIIRKRLEVVEAFINSDVKELQGKLMDKLTLQQEKNLSKKETKKQIIEKCIKSNLATTEERIIELVERVSKYVTNIDKIFSKEITNKSYLKEEFLEYLDKLKRDESYIHNTENRTYLNCINMLRRNPSVKAREHEEAMEELKKINESFEKNINNKRI